MGQNELSFEPCHPGGPSGASETNFEPMVQKAQTKHPSCTETNTISKRTEKEILHDPRHLGIPSRASKMISVAMVRLVQTMDLSCTKTNTIYKWTKTRFYMTHVT
jgi:hypothetical protein